MNWRGEKKMRGTYHSRRAVGDATKGRRKDTAEEKKITQEKDMAITAGEEKEFV
jgi:hypothetical protein